MKKDILNERYGLVPMTLEQEVNISETVRVKRSAKVNIVDDIASIRMMCEAIENRAKGIPENENEEHAQIVREFQKRVRELYLLASDISEFGFSK